VGRGVRGRDDAGKMTNAQCKSNRILSLCNEIYIKKVVCRQ
jgi:hypothetical protein